MSLLDAFELAAIAAGVTVFALAIGTLALRARHRRSIGAQIVALTCSTVLAVIAGAYAASRAMFISQHDLTALVVVLGAAGGVAILVAIVLGSRVGTASRALVAAARRIGDEGVTPPGPLERNAPAELVDLARELAATQARLDDARTRQRISRCRGESSSRGSHTICEPRSRGCGRSSRHSRTASSRIRRRWSATCARCARRWTISRPSWTTSSSSAALRPGRSGSSSSVYPWATSSRTCWPGPLRSRPPNASASRVGSSARLPSSRSRLPRYCEPCATCSNAIRHTPSDGSVVIEAGVDDELPDYAYVAVRDSGGGVPPEDLPRIFDVAFQSDRARTPGAGAGLGLAIAKGFVEAHDGQLNVQNDAGGAIFTMRLPRVRA